MSTDILLEAFYDEEKLRKRLQRNTKDVLIDIIVHLAQKYMKKDSNQD